MNLWRGAPSGNKQVKARDYGQRILAVTPSYTKPTFKGETNAIKDHVFIYNQIHNKNWMTSRQKFINYTRRTYGSNEETSLELRTITIVTAKMPDVPTTTELATMGDFEKEMAKDDYKQDRKTYKDIIQKTNINLTKLYKIL